MPTSAIVELFLLQLDHFFQENLLCVECDTEAK